METTAARQALGRQFRKARMHKELSQVQAAELIKCNPNEISLYESGARVPDLPRFAKMVKVYGADAGSLLFHAAKAMKGKAS